MLAQTVRFSNFWGVFYLFFLGVSIAPVAAMAQEKEPHALPTAYNPSWVTEKGQVVHLSDYYGKVVLLNMWATWCRPCLAEMPSLEKLQKRYGKGGLVVLPVVRDDSGVSTWAKMRRFFHQARIQTLPLLQMPTEEMLTGLPVEMIPTTFIFDRTGRLITFHTRAKDWFEEESRVEIENILRQPDPTARPFERPAGMLLELRL